jgi:hypothetical protein
MLPYHASPLGGERGQRMIAKAKAGGKAAEIALHI